MKARFKIGQQFIRQHTKRKDVETITDILTTRNTSDEVVKIRYVAEHDFMGQTVTDYDVLDTTIAKGLIE